jgi:nuclear transport factor 2 (NTF2) superfamily protein
MTAQKPPLPPFTRETALQKVQAAEDAWNTRDPERVAQAYTVDSVWRNRDVFVTGRRRDHRLPHPEVGARARVRAAQEPLVFRR